MQDSESPSRPHSLWRRDFIKAAAGAAVAMTVLKADAATPQAQPLQPWWAARPSSADANRPVAIDLHAHWVPAPYAKAMAEIGQPIRNIYPLEADIAPRVKWMDEHGVQMHLLTLSGGMPWQVVTAEQGALLAQVVNDAGAEAHAAYPNRFVAAIELPIRDAKLALKELDRVAGRPGLRAVHLPDSIENRDYLFEPEFAPLLARCEELGYPIVFHNLNADLFGKRPTAQGLDNTFAHAVLAAKFITSGTLDKFPRLELVLPHAGGAFPYVAGRLEHFLYHMGAPVPERATPAPPFKEYLRRFHYDYLTYHPEGFLFLMNLVGSDRIVVGTDSFNARDIEYPSAVVEQFNLPAVDRDRILKGNATRLLRL